MVSQNKALQSRLEATLGRFVAMPTDSNDLIANSDAIKALASEFVSLGMAVHVEENAHPWLIATANPKAQSTKRVKILLVIHFDVVSPADDAHFTIRIADDKIFGRGVIDMKFAAAVAHELVKDLAAEDTLAAYDFGILITSDEERGGRDGALDFLQKGWRCDLAIVPDGGRDWKVEQRAKGLLYVYLKAEGLSAHSSRTWEGKNPLPQFLPALQKIIDHFPNDDPNGTVVSINTLQSTNSGAINSTQTPAWVKAGISVRAFENHQLETALRFIEQVAAQHGLRVQVSLHDSPVHLLEESPLVQEFLTALSDVRQKPVEFTQALGASDARYFAALNIPTAIIYPEGGDMHGANEWLRRGDLSTFYNLLATYLQRNAFNAQNLSLGSIGRLAKYKEAVASIVKKVQNKL
ncbi:MAG TPA: M20/M25/M40 family metallo-hydrolase [Candidatus Saccharimonadales bacterium]|nr:M20/M25/M40 family metallo-hydrolase [Candidatus Saccharimonadales bacterium]